MAPSLGKAIGHILGRINTQRCACGSVKSTLRFISLPADAAPLAAATRLFSGHTNHSIEPSQQLFNRGAAQLLLASEAQPNGSAETRRSWFGSVALLGLLSSYAIQYGGNAAWAEEQEYAERREEEGASYGTFSEALHRKLVEIVGEDNVETDLEERKTRGKPWNTYHVLKGFPDAVVFPQSTEEVSQIVKACAAEKVPLVPFGGGTSLEGHTMTPHKGVSLDFSKMKGIKQLNTRDMDVIVEPGIGWVELNEYLKPLGFFFPLDPGPGASIGGMCATRCSGSLAVRYGTMRDNVISMKAVLANGDVVKTSARSRKSAAGYDLTRLIIGSEGTLAVITEVTLRLQRIPEATAVAMCTFPTIKDAADASIAAMHSGIQVSRVEMLDEVMMRGINEATGRTLPEKPTLMFEFVGSQASVIEQAQRVEKLSKGCRGSDFVYTQDADEKEELWRVRKEAFWSTFTLRPGAEAMVTDVCVPLSKLADSIAETKVELEASSLVCPILSHAGDGNYHVIILFDPADPREVAEANQLAKDMVHRAIAAEGSCTGEHGIGLGKMKFLEEELGPEAIATMGKIKKALDPDNILNPGKIIPSQFCH
ncbi:FAD/FMN-containing dehydrogenases [Klebsormidium nitens]|uniref:D-lactate dehydrogenase (cytochrome) n=1 Tax=Klebsormidium nitens TaxID=105231 RepID=A0A1Y1ISM4_KLENI|nr:FAD/FMN-containing dehydrogenases [Klebsormidium nitens]|eukprot:GAQ91178.1 FAD/FMN-containing dehydrogenases [Klebsormidium nitens]